MARIEQESFRKEMADLLVVPRLTKSLQNDAGFSGKTRTSWACRKGKGGLSATVSSWPKRLSLLCQKENQQSHQSISPDCEGKKVKVSESGTLARKREIKQREPS